jgi:hypothetical protein
MIRKSVKRFSEKHALGLDPRDHAQRKNLDLDPIQSNWIKVQSAMMIHPQIIAL